MTSSSLTWMTHWLVTPPKIGEKWADKASEFAFGCVKSGVLAGQQVDQRAVGGAGLELQREVEAGGEDL